MDYELQSKERINNHYRVRLSGLPPPLYDRAYIGAILPPSHIFWMLMTESKLMKFARARIEIDVTQIIPDRVWVNMGGENGYWQDIKIETKLAYRSKCRVHGHDLSICRKANPSNEYKNKEVFLY